jgi:hypothetical protein
MRVVGRSVPLATAVPSSACQKVTGDEKFRSRLPCTLRPPGRLARHGRGAARRRITAVMTARSALDDLIWTSSLESAVPCPFVVSMIDMGGFDRACMILAAASVDGSSTVEPTWPSGSCRGGTSRTMRSVARLPIRWGLDGALRGCTQAVEPVVWSNAKDFSILPILL